MNPNPHPDDDPRPGLRPLKRRLRRGPPLILDGAIGTELERRGQAAGLPLWSSHALLDAPECVLEIHRDYLEAGAEILTANTFRTQRRTLRRGGRGRDPGDGDLGLHDAELTALAVTLARRAARESHTSCWIAGSAPPLEDCYRPDRVPGSKVLYAEHERHVENLLRAGVDLILIETMNTIREARLACEVARKGGLPVLVSFVAGRGSRLLSGETLAQAALEIHRVGADAVLVNCLPLAEVEDCIAVLRRTELPFGVYANLGQPNHEGNFLPDRNSSPEDFASHALRWLEAGAQLVGGCCGTTPDHIRALARKTEKP